MPESRSRNHFKDRSAVQRRRAPAYLLITLLCFAFAVIATRVFLNLTGFPQLGGGELHIAHVLWGGLFLFVASLLPLIFVNQWTLELSAALAGVGVGLFIDEVGKFITRNNDYFYPSAAPIIYAFFLLTVLVFVLVRRNRKHSQRETMYAILEDFAEVLDRDLSEDEFLQLSSRLDQIIEKGDEPHLVSLAKSLRQYLEDQKQLVVPHDPGMIEKFAGSISIYFNHQLSLRTLRVIVILGMALWGIWALTSQTVMFLATHNPQQFNLLLQQFMQNRLVRDAAGMNWFEVEILLEGSMGLGALLSVILFLFRKDRIASRVGIFDLIFSLTVVNLLTFYFNQFSTIAFAAYQAVLLIFLLLLARRQQNNNYIKHHRKSL